MTDRPAILVTGGAGYIGSHCCRALAAAGYDPVTYSTISRPDIAASSLDRLFSATSKTRPL